MQAVISLQPSQQANLRTLCSLRALSQPSLACLSVHINEVALVEIKTHGRMFAAFYNRAVP